MKGHNVQIYFLNSSLDLIFALSESKSLLMKARSEPTFLVIQMRLENWTYYSLIKGEGAAWWTLYFSIWAFHIIRDVRCVESLWAVSYVHLNELSSIFEDKVSGVWADPGRCFRAKEIEVIWLRFLILLSLNKVSVQVQAAHSWDGNHPPFCFVEDSEADAQGLAGLVFRHNLAVLVGVEPTSYHEAVVIYICYAELLYAAWLAAVSGVCNKLV